MSRERSQLGHVVVATHDVDSLFENAGCWCLGDGCMYCPARLTGEGVRVRAEPCIMRPGIGEIVGNLPPTAYLAVACIVGTAALAVWQMCGAQHGVYLTLCAAFTFFLTYNVWGTVSLEADLTAAAREHIGNDTVTVGCEGFLSSLSFSGQAGWAEPTQDASSGGWVLRSAHLQGSICDGLASWMGRDRGERATDDEVMALVVYAHETTHMRDIFNEAETQCRAMREVDELAERLAGSGRSVDYGTIGSRFFSTFYPMMPASYRLSTCVL